jgi:hypothetical protein
LLALLVLIGTSLAVLSFVEGWLGVLLWAIVAVPLCITFEIFLQASAKEQKKPHSLPRVAVRKPWRGLDQSAQGASLFRRPDPFRWGPEAEGGRRRERGPGPGKRT